MARNHKYLLRSELDRDYLKFMRDREKAAKKAQQQQFEPGYTGDGFTHQADEDLAEQEACDRAAGRC